MKASTRKVVKVVWVLFAIIILLITSPYSVLYVFYAFFCIQSCDARDVDAQLLIMGLAPLIIVGTVSYFLFNRFHKMDRADMMQGVLIETGQGITMDEKKVIHVLHQNGTISLRELSATSGIPETVILITVKELIERNVIRQHVSLGGEATFSLTQTLN